MRKISPFKLAAILIFATHAIIAQQWYPIGAKWTFNKQELMPYQAHGIVEYKVVKDTIMNDTIAKRVDVLSTSYQGNLRVSTPIYVSEMNSKVYVWEKNHFSIMYDMTLDEGDTLKMNNRLCPNLIYSIVDSVSFMKVDGEELKVQYISYAYNLEEQTHYGNEHIIEKIGNENDFIFWLNCYHIDMFAYTGLRCYKDTALLYRNPEWSRNHSGVDCDSLINGKDTSIDAVSSLINVLISPNPTRSFTKVEVGNHSVIKSIELYNIQGQFISVTLGAENECDLDLSNMPNGVYLAKIRLLNSEERTFKIFKK